MDCAFGLLVVGQLRIWFAGKQVGCAFVPARAGRLRVPSVPQWVGCAFGLFWSVWVAHSSRFGAGVVGA
jgi:hypothetical protein